MMNLPNVEHILRAAGDATGQKAFVLIGSASIIDVSTMRDRLHRLPTDRVLGGMAALEERLVILGRRALRSGDR